MRLELEDQTRNNQSFVAHYNNLNRLENYELYSPKTFFSSSINSNTSTNHRNRNSIVNNKTDMRATRETLDSLKEVINKLDDKLNTTPNLTSEN